MIQQPKKLCVVTPYRNREAHLRQFLPHLSHFLAAQGVPYLIAVVEQRNDRPFNRGRLLNIGYCHLQGDADYFCFHDVDMLPLVSDYSICTTPTHLAAQVEQFEWTLPYARFLGGVTLFDKASFERVNGYPNDYWGWGGEDDELYKRCVRLHVPLSRRLGRYRSLSHDRPLDKSLYHENIRRLSEFDRRFAVQGGLDGLSTLQYKLVEARQITDGCLHVAVDF